MKLSNAIAKLTKSGFDVTQSKHSQWDWYAKKQNNDWMIEIISQGGVNVENICVKRVKDKETDINAGYYDWYFRKTISSAIETVARWSV